MPPKKKPDASISVGVSMKGELAQVFEDLFFTALRNKQVSSRAEFARTLIVAQLRTMGFEVEDNMQWGGQRTQEDSDAPELVGSLVGTN